MRRIIHWWGLHYSSFSCLHPCAVKTRWVVLDTMRRYYWWSRAYMNTCLLPHCPRRPLQVPFRRALTIDMPWSHFRHSPFIFLLQQSPTGPPVSQQTTPSPSTCEDQAWYYDANVNACARDTNFAAGTLYATSGDCCSATSSLFSDGCIIFDGCNSQQPSKVPTLAPITVSIRQSNLSYRWYPIELCFVHPLCSVSISYQSLQYRYSTMSTGGSYSQTNHWRNYHCEWRDRR